MNQNAQKLRQALQQQSYLMMPGIYDCLSAKMAENAGFQAAFFSGGAFSMATLGKPDIGFFNLTEAVHTLRRIVDSVNIPILSDATTALATPSTPLTPPAPLKPSAWQASRWTIRCFPKASPAPPRSAMSGAMWSPNLSPSARQSPPNL